MYPPLLKTSNVVIRAFEDKDLQRFADYRAQASVAKYQNWSDYSYQNALELFAGMDYSSFGTEGRWYQLAIADIETDNLVGDLAVHFIDDAQVEVGFTVDPAFQGKGIATQAIQTLLHYLFYELKKHRVVATADVRNVASYKTLEKLDFRREAHFKKNVFFKGAWGDEYQYALLCSEFCRSEC